MSYQPEDVGLGPQTATAEESAGEESGYLILVKVPEEELPTMEAFLRKHPILKGGIRYRGEFPFTVFAALTPDELEDLQEEITAFCPEAVIHPLEITHNWEPEETSHEQEGAT